ncbi:branched-chain amino acid ABC transporter substrate-binding protein [Herbaspirillum lusitanum]|uniref:branched-chain amino acid ABC transporter substrate-binding protein n=1 Tax=Herbaspirillum lusitanum TaxID=213312 RepID=UPI0022388B71|nr:branched-chain amino acid ABC transporter substrate-binding protein [Herbaspirillum lusitanum]
MKTARLRRCCILLWLTMPAWLPVAVGAADITEVPIGIAMPLTGPAAAFGKSLVNAAEMAIDDANRRHPKVAGRAVRFKLLVVDERGSTRTAALAANYLIKQGVVASIGNGSTFTTLATARIFSDAGIAQLAPSASAPWPEGERHTTFRMIGHSGQGAPLLADYLVDNLHALNAAVIDNGTRAGNMFGAAFKERFQARKGKVVSSDSIQFRSSDFNTILEATRLKRPDVIFFGGLADQAAALVRNVRRVGLQTTFVHGMNGTNGLNFLRDAGAAADGVLAINPGMPTDKMPGWKNFEKEYLQRFGGNINDYAPITYDAVQVLVAAVRDADSFLPARILAALYKVRYSGLTGTISFDRNGNLLNPIFTIYQMKDMHWLPLQTYDASKS